MLRSRIATFTEPDEFAAAVRGSDMDFLITAKGDFRAEVLTIEANRLWMLRNETVLPAVARHSISSERAAILFRATSAPRVIYHNGKELPPDALLVLGRDSVNHFRLPGAFCAAGMSLTPEDLAATGEALLGRELTVPQNSAVHRPPAAAMARLMSLHEAVGHLARTVPDILAPPAVAESMEQTLIGAMISCLSDHSTTQANPVPARHAKIIKNFEDYLAARRYEAVHLPEICAEIGVSERTLRACCQERFGMGPIRYLWLRRMHLARRALLRADPMTSSVTSTATGYGFWELGRFSVEYRALFGESPRDTLHGIGRGH
jgi:AraC-like DNA-binding protein